MSLTLSQDARQKITQWVQLYKVHKPFQTNDVSVILSSQKPQENPHNKFYLLTMKHIANLKPPAKAKALSTEIVPPELSSKKPTEKRYSLQCNVSLHNPATGFFGRTYRGRQMPLRLIPDTQDLVSDDNDWTVFYTKSEARETKAIVEVIIIEQEIGGNNKRKARGVGYAVVPLFYDELPITAEILKGNPRDVLKNDPTFQPEHTGSILYFEFKNQDKKFMELMPLLPDNILIGYNDDLPGIVTSRLPLKAEEITAKCKLVPIKTVYAHNIRISSMNEVESSFSLFLKDWNKYQSIGDNQSDGKAEIVERRLTVLPHNTWRGIGSSSFVSLNKELNGIIQSSGAIKVLNYPLHPMISLIFKLEYRGKSLFITLIVQFHSEKDQKKTDTKDFVLGWCIFVPQINDLGDNLKDEEVQLDLILGPGMTLFGDVLWDQSLVRKERKLFVKMAVMLTTSEDLVSEAEKKKQADAYMKQAEQKVQNQMKNLDAEKKKEQEKLKQIQEENERLKKEKEELEQQKHKPPEEVLIKNSTENKAVERQKEYYKSKNEEIEELIEQVIKSQKKGDDSVIPKDLLDQGDQSVASLLRFLIQIVMQNYGPEEQHMASDARKEITHKNLLELLKSGGDSRFKMNVFGSQGGMSILQCKELSRQDKINLLKIGIGKNLLDPETEAKLLATEPKMEVELMDQYKASTLSFKFVALKTPIQFNPDLRIPQKLYFTLKFFTFKTVQSEKVMLKSDQQALQQNSQNIQPNLQENIKIKLGSQYLLQKINPKDTLDQTLQIIFDVDPSISGVEDEHLHLARYFKDRILTIDLWDGDALMHFGTCKVPLYQLLRQGEPTKVFGQEYDICEPEFGNYVGGLQLLITNEGRKVGDKFDKNKSPQKLQGGLPLSQTTVPQKHKKKVLSKPIENFNQIADGQLSNLAQTYEYTKQNVTTMHQSEEARKKLRVERLKRQTAGVELKQQVSFNDPKANEWDKMNSLKQIEIIRETKKVNLLNKVLKESMATKQNVDAIPGQPTLVHFIVQNPFPQDEVFQVIVNDPDAHLFQNGEQELSIVHNENLEWQFWFNEGKCNRPSEWDIVSSKNDLLLRSGQQCPLLFKFLSFREPISEAALHNKEQQQSNLKELRPRKIKITVISRDQMPISTLEVKILPREQYCDQIFRFYEPQSVKTYIKLPKFVPFQLTGMTLKTSNKEMKADINQEGGIYIVTQTEKAPKKSDCYLFIYQDHYFSQLLACCKIEVYALQCIRQKIQAGPETLYQLQVRSNVKRTIEIFSSNHRLVFPPGKKERNLQILQPNELSTINIGVKASASGTQRARIHCVDINTKELIQSWLFEIEADKPQVQKAYQIQTVVGRHTPYKFPYTNPLNEFVTLMFVSSKNRIMEVRREKQGFEAHENKYIDLYVPPQNKVGQEEVILYITDESGRISESLLFKIVIKE